MRDDRAELVIYFREVGPIPDQRVEISSKLETPRVPGGVIDLTQGWKVEISAVDFRNLAQYFDEPIGTGRLCLPMPAGGPAYVVR